MQATAIQEMLAARGSVAQHTKVYSSTPCGTCCYPTPSRTSLSTTVNQSSAEQMVGTVFAGHRIEAVIGTGGMGTVYRATDLALERATALRRSSRSSRVTRTSNGGS